MKLTKFLVVAGLVLSTFLGTASALPSFANLDARQRDHIEQLMKRDGIDARQLKLPTIGRKKIPDADHQFQAPSSTAQRGPCPGLNVLANHGYLDREGITNFNELLYAQQEAMGWAIDLSTLLAAIAVAVDGNPLNGKVSIGGPDARVGTIPLLGGGKNLPGGILKHDAYEIDASLTRNNINLGGDNKNFNGTLYQQIWDVADAKNGGKLNGEVMAIVRSNRYSDSVRDDPKFTFAPIGSLFFGADQFLYNTQVTSGEDGEPGEATRETLSKMYGAKRTGESTWTYVPEQFPDDWYRRARPLTIPEAVKDAVPSLVMASSKGQLPVGITPANVQSPEAFTCAIKSVLLGQIPAAILGIDVAGQFIKQLGSIGGSC